MESILEWLCDAPIAYNARPCAPDSPALEHVKARVQLMDSLRSTLTPEQTALLDACDDLSDDAEDDFSYRKFVYGFHLGAALTLEILQGRDALLPH